MEDSSIYRIEVVSAYIDSIYFHVTGNQRNWISAHGSSKLSTLFNKIGLTNKSYIEDQEKDKRTIYLEVPQK